MRMLVESENLIHNKYYLQYILSGDNKRLHIFKWSGLFSYMQETKVNWYGVGIAGSSNSHNLLGSTVNFELDSEEEFKQITMPLIADNL